MQYFRGATAAEFIAVRVDAGEELLEALGQAVTETQVAAGAVLSGVGSLEHFNLEVPANLLWPPTAYAVEKQGPGQIISAQGHVVSGAVELFLSVARRNEVFAGKVLPGTRVLHTVEFTLLRAGNSRWTCVPHPQTGVPLLQAAGPPPAGPVTLMGRPVDPAAIALVPAALLRKHGCLPVARSGDTLVVAMADPSNPFAVDELREATRLRIQTVAVPANELMPALHQALSGRG
jgi:predicted DNA-binding protein with PD1-like motif